jgi:hypothetical protein
LNRGQSILRRIPRRKELQAQARIRVAGHEGLNGAIEVHSQHVITVHTVP